MSDSIKEQIEKDLGFTPPTTAGWHITLKTYIRPKEAAKFLTITGEEKAIEFTEESLGSDQYQSIVGQVINLGPEVYQDKERYPSGPWCKLGDWVTFRLNRSFKMKYRGVHMRIIPEDAVLNTIEDPSWVTRD